MISEYTAVLPSFQKRHLLRYKLFEKALRFDQQDTLVDYSIYINSGSFVFHNRIAGTFEHEAFGRSVSPALNLNFPVQRTQELEAKPKKIVLK